MIIEKGLEDLLVVIPANISGITPDGALLPFLEKTLLFRSLDLAKKLVPDEQVCVVTSDDEVRKYVVQHGLDAPFELPEVYYNGYTDVDELILFTIDYFARKGKHYGKIALLSAYSPYCTALHILEAHNLLLTDTDMVLGVRLAEANECQPIWYEAADGFLVKLEAAIDDSVVVYRSNEAFSLFRTVGIRQSPRAYFRRIRKYLMSAQESVFVRTREDIEAI